MVQLTVTQSDIIHSDEAKERKQGKKVPNLSLSIIPRYPSTANHLFLKGYLCKWPKKENSLWRQRERRKRKKGRGKSLSLIWSTNASYGSLQQTEVPILGIPRQKTTAFLSYYCVLYAPDPTLPSAILLPSVLRVKCCKHTRTVQGGWRRNGGGRDNTNTKATSPLVPIIHVTEESSPSKC